VADRLFEGEEAVLHVIERIVARLGLRERRRLGFQAETEPLRLHQVVITPKPYASTPSKSTTAADLVTGHRVALPHRGFAGSGAGGSSLVLALCPRRALTAGGCTGFAPLRCLSARYTRPRKNARAPLRPSPPTAPPLAVRSDTSQAIRNCLAGHA
jgi:hypothetical protein